MLFNPTLSPLSAQMTNIPLFLAEQTVNNDLLEPSNINTMIHYTANLTLLIIQTSKNTATLHEY